jgi:hypothetical protein
MKRLLPCFLLLVVGYAAVAQERVIDEATYNEQIRRAGEYRLKENYRVERLTEMCEKDSCIWKPMSVDVMEYDHPGKRRSYFIDTQRGQTKPSTEFIWIDDKVYAKRPNMDWKLEDQITAPNSINPTTETIKIEYKDLGIERSGQIEYRVLLKTSHSRHTLNGEASDHIQMIKSWIDKTGRLNKQVYLMTSSKGRSTRLTMSYEVDPGIKVEVPIK